MLGGKKVVLYLFLVIVLAGFVYGVECGPTPTDGCTITQNTTFNPDTYNLPNGISIGAPNIYLDCNGSNLVGSGFGGGILLNNQDNVIVRNCDITYYVYGIILLSSSNNSIIHNTVNLNTYGIMISSSNNNKLISNIVNNNYIDGILLGSSSNNNLTNNTATNNQYGIRLRDSSSNTVTNNIANSNELGIYLDDSSNNNLINNTANHNLGYGLYFDSYSNNNTINMNTFCDNNQSGGDYYDIYDVDSNSGDKNACDTAYNWDDDGTTNCTKRCSDLYGASLDVLLLSMGSIQKGGSFSSTVEEFIDVINETEALAAKYVELDSEECGKTFGVKVTNPSDWNIENVIEQLIIRANASYIMLLGGLNVIPRPMINFTCPAFYLNFSLQPNDMVYIDLNDDQIADEGLVISRLPDYGTNSDAVIKALNTSIEIHKEGGYNLSKPAEFSQYCGSVSYLTPCYPVPPYCMANIPDCTKYQEAYDILSSSSDVIFTGHGSSSSFCIDESLIPNPDLNTWHPLVSAFGPCEAGMLNTLPNNAVEYIKIGARNFIGRTSSEGVGNVYVLAPKVYEYLYNGSRIGDALFDGIRYFSLMNCTYKWLSQHQLYGDPTIKLKNYLVPFNISLTPGWNLISTPLDLQDKNINSIFTNLDITIFSYNNSWFIPTKIENKLGYWLKINESKNLTLIGTEIENKTIELNQGWNLIGYQYLNETDINNSNLKNYTIFNYMNTSWLSYNPNRINSLNTLQKLMPGYGYWLNVP